MCLCVVSWPSGVRFCFVVRFFPRSSHATRQKTRVRGRVAAKNREFRNRGVVSCSTKRTERFPNFHDRASNLSPNTGYQQLGELHTAARLETPLPQAPSRRAVPARAPDSPPPRRRRGAVGVVLSGGCGVYSAHSTGVWRFVVSFPFQNCFCGTITLRPTTAPWPRRHSRRAARGPPRLSGASWRRGRRTNGLLPSGLVRVDRRGGNAASRWRIRTFAAARSRRQWCRKSAKKRYDARIISSSSFLTKPSYGAFPRGVLVGLIPKSGRESTEKSSNYDTTCVMNRP